MQHVLAIVLLPVMIAFSVALWIFAYRWSRSSISSVRAYRRAASSEERRASTIRLTLLILVCSGVLAVIIVAPFGTHTFAYVLAALGVSLILLVNICVLILVKKNARRQ